jgi:hypothetical protein
MMKITMTAGALLLMTGTAVLAEDKPWDLPKPDGMTATHQKNAIEARKVQEALPEGAFGFDPIQAEWDWNGGMNRNIPLSNMNGADLGSLLNGRYHITSDVGEDEWMVRYYDPSGKTYFCGYSSSAQEHKEWVLDRYISNTPFGMSGVFHWDPATEATPVPEDSVTSWPIVVDGDRGLVFNYSWNGSHWIPEPGWVQSEYAAAFAEYCPTLPRGSLVNNDQLGVNFADLIGKATPVRGTQTDFVNDPQEPLTASMYYWLNSPE